MTGWWAASYVILWVLVLALIVLVVALARQIGTLHMRLGPRGALEMDDEGPPLGTLLPEQKLTDTAGSEVSLGGPGEAQLVLFVSPGCGVCEQVLPSVPVIAQERRLAPYVLTDQDVHETLRAYGGRELRAPLVPAQFAAQEWDVPGTPYVIVTDENGIIQAKGTVNNLEQMEGLVETGLQRAAQTPDMHT